MSLKIIVTNDDGYQAKGINTLAEELMDLGEVIVIAPDRNRSGASNSLTIDSPLRVNQVKENWYYVNGTPTDCVHLVVTGLLGDKLPDMVISGINHGANLGDDILYSGTVAAAIEGRFLGLPSIAISLCEPCQHFKTAALVAKKILKKLYADPLPKDTIISINVPDVPIEEIQGFEVTRLGTRHIAEPSIKQHDPRGNDVYWVGLPGAAADSGPGTDFNAIKTKMVSLTPLKIELTNYKTFDQLAQWVKSIDTKFTTNL